MFFHILHFVQADIFLHDIIYQISKEMGPFKAQHFNITKDITNGSFCCYVRCPTLIVRESGNVLAHKQAQLITMHS